MAVIHHAYRCRWSPELTDDLRTIATAWSADDRGGLAALALRQYQAIAGHCDMLQSFGIASTDYVISWLQPEFITPGLASFVTAARYFERVPSLSHSQQSNFHVIETVLPLLGVPRDLVQLMVRGRPIERVLQDLALTSAVVASKLSHLGGWVSAKDAAHALQSVKVKLEAATALPSPEPTRLTQAVDTLRTSGALGDLTDMLRAVQPPDWLVVNLVW